MRILVTNDDSVSASGLLPLVKYCQKLGDVTVVVPKFEQSGKSHGIELHEAYEAKQIELEPGLTGWTVDSTPADCVRFAILGLRKEFDLVISGVNRGYNIGTDQIYSGTVGAALEAVALDTKAIALSTCPQHYENVVEDLDRVFAYIFDNKLLDVHNAYNVNIPPQPKGIRITRQGGPYYSDDYKNVGGDMYKAGGICVYQDNGDPSLDTNTVIHGSISVMPITYDRTDWNTYQKLQMLNK